jgi:uncharacterized membrane protein YesL
MVALIEFIVVGLVFVLLLKLSRPEKDTSRDRKISFKQIVKVVKEEFWAYYVIPLVLLILALNIAYNIEYWRVEMKGVLLSALMLFCSFFIFTATYLRMKDTILGENLSKSE